MSDLKVRIGADSAEFDKKMKGMMSSVKSLAGVLGAGIGIGAAVNYTKKLIDGLDDVGKTSKNLGISAEFYQKLAFAADRSGSSAEAAAKGIKFLEKNIVEAKNGNKEAASTFNQLGLSVGELSGMNPEELFLAVSSAISSMENPADRTAYAMKLLGKSGAELGVTMRDYAGLAAELEASGTIIKDEDVAAAEAFNDAMTNIGKSIEAAVVNSGLIQWLADVADRLSAVASLGNQLGAKSGIGAPGSAGYRGGVGGFFSNLKDAYFGESEGEQLRTIDTDEDRRRLEENRRKFEESGGKTKAQRDSEADAARKAAVEAEKVRSAKEKEQKAQEKLDAKTLETIDQMKQEVRWQEMKNNGKEREAEIEKAIYDARKQNKSLTDEQARQIGEAAGTLFDVSQKQKDEKTKIINPADIPEISNQFMRVGAFMGSDYQDFGKQNLEQKQVTLLEKIEKNTKQSGDYKME